MSQARSESTDEQLMLRFQSGEKACFVELVRRHQNPLYNFALRHMRSNTVAEDIVQDAFVRVVQNAADFKHQSRFSTWVYTIVRNLCVDELRKRALRMHASLDAPRTSDSDSAGPTLGEQLPDARASVEREATGGELKVQITGAIQELPDEQREVFLLREVSNLPFKEIAEITGVSENTVKSRMRYALERLQSRLSEFEEYARALK